MAALSYWCSATSGDETSDDNGLELESGVNVDHLLTPASDPPSTNTPIPQPPPPDPSPPQVSLEQVAVKPSKRAPSVSKAPHCCSHLFHSLHASRKLKATAVEMARAMSDDQVASELKKMTAFIKQEALEKAQEIKIKADEEFAIEKSKLVRSETASIDAEYAKKSKQAAMSQQITRSTLANKTRLRVLSARQELLDELFEKAREELKGASKDKGKYEGVLKGLVLEGLYALLEKKVVVRARKEDKEVLGKAIEAAKKEYKEKTGQDVEIQVDEKDPLPEDSVGGVVAVGGNGKIEFNNTLEERLRLLETDALPSLRVKLFGKNENRRFYD